LVTLEAYKREKYWEFATSSNFKGFERLFYLIKTKTKILFHFSSFCGDYFLAAAAANAYEFNLSFFLSSLEISFKGFSFGISSGFGANGSSLNHGSWSALAGVILLSGLSVSILHSNLYPAGDILFPILSIRLHSCG